MTGTVGSEQFEGHIKSSRTIDEPKHTLGGDPHAPRHPFSRPKRATRFIELHVSRKILFFRRVSRVVFVVQNGRSLGSACVGTSMQRASSFPAGPCSRRNRPRTAEQVFSVRIKMSHGHFCCHRCLDKRNPDVFIQPRPHIRARWLSPMTVPAAGPTNHAALHA